MHECVCMYVFHLYEKHTLKFIPFKRTACKICVNVLIHFLYDTRLTARVDDSSAVSKFAIELIYIHKPF